MSNSQTDIKNEVRGNNIFLTRIAVAIFTAGMGTVLVFLLRLEPTLGLSHFGGGITIAGLVQALIFGLVAPERGETGEVRSAYFASRVYLMGWGFAAVVLGIALTVIDLFDLPALSWGLITWAIAAVGLANILRAQLAGYGSGSRVVYATLALVFGCVLSLVAAIGPLFKIAL